MKKKCLLILLLTIILIPCKIFAAGGFNLSNSSITMYPGDTKTITISSYDSVGRLNISSSNGGVASISINSTFIDSVGVSKTFTITANSVGNATITVIGSENYATYSEESSLEGLKRNITVNVVAKPTSQPSNPKPVTPQKPQNNLSKNNNIKSLSVDGYELVKLDEKNYTLTVSNDITSINVNATSEDSKAKVTGTGVKELQIGENNIEIIVTSESGSQNKIAIKVTRKDGYYLEDLESVLKNTNLQDADIIINANSLITKEQLNQIKASSKTLRFNYYDENKNLIYSWIVNGKEINELNEFTTSISFVTENMKEIYKLSNYADGLYLDFKHTGNLPTGTKIKLYVGNKFENENNIKIYQFNDKDKELELINDNLKVKDGYIEFPVDKCLEYFVTMSTIGTVKVVNEETSSNLFMILSIVEIIIIVGLVTFILIKSNQLKKNNLY